MKKLILLILFTVSITSNLFAEKIANSVRINGESPKIDGRLDDEAWKSAIMFDDFKVKEPIEGANPSEKIECKIMYDDNALYFSAKMFRKDISKIRTSAFKRDNTFNAEKVMLILDPFLDKRTSFTFLLCASGSKSDYISTGDNEYNRDFTFDPVWEGATNIDAEGWTAEMRIPFSQLHFHNTDQQVWGMNINQYTPSSKEDVYWSMIGKNEAGWASKFGNLIGINGIKNGKRIEFLPYVASSLISNPNVESDNPFIKKNQFGYNGGLDFKMGLGSNFTLNATINPDFGQVEADPAIVNLTEYEVEFAEKRPFFTEGQKFFEGNGKALFYSRRVGGPPKGSLSGDYVKVPQNTRILGALKLNGRTEGGFSFGAISAITNKEYGQSYSKYLGSSYEVQIEPLTYFNVIRAEQDLNANSSFVGIKLTGVERELCSCNGLIDKISKRAYTASTDITLRLDSNNYELSAILGGSYIEGNKAAMINMQTSPIRYLQRFDSPYKIDSLSNYLTGVGSVINFKKIGGKNWLWGTTNTLLSPYFELNDIGYMQSVDYLETNNYIKYRENTPNDYFYSLVWENYSINRWDFSGVNTKNLFGSNLTYFLPSRDNLFISWDHEFSAMSNNKTRGGVLMKKDISNSFVLGYETDWSKITKFILNFYGALYELGGREQNYTFGVTSRVSNGIEFNFTAKYYINFDTRQYVTTIDGDRPEVLNKRYIFANIAQNTLSTQFRINFTASPTLTFELYGEPFISNGVYSNYGELEYPRDNKLITYGKDKGTLIAKTNDGYTVKDGNNEFNISNNNFNKLSFRSNFVIRWEWMLGSTLYFVWQQSRFENQINQEFKANNIFNSLSATGINSLALKISYWVPWN